MTDQQNPMPPGWYPDPMQPGHQREWSGYEWVGPSVPLAAGKKKGGFPKWLIPVIACVGLAFVAIVGGAIAGSGSSDDDEPTAEAEADPAAGMFARCTNGEFSDNGDLTAICSSHDGVAEFLADFGECEDGTVIALQNDPQCPDGGDLVKLLPDYVPEAGPDDIALCTDGTYSDNLDLTATCSSHDGVAEWLAAYGECESGDVIELTGIPLCPAGENLARLLPDYDPTATTEPPTTDAPTTTAPAELPGVGGTDTTSGLEVTLHQVVDPWTSSNEFDTPPNGQRYIAVEMEVKNTNPDTEIFSSLVNVEVIDSMNRAWDVTITITDDPLIDGDIPAGASRRGWLYIAAANDATGLVMRVKGSFTAEGAEFALG